MDRHMTSAGSGDVRVSGDRPPSAALSAYSFKQSPIRWEALTHCLCPVILPQFRVLGEKREGRSFWFKLMRFQVSLPEQFEPNSSFSWSL